MGKFNFLDDINFSKKRYRTFIKMLCGKDVCQITGWDIGTCDVHHIVPLSEGGKEMFSNYIMVSPNSHRLCHEEYYSIEDLIKYKIKFFNKVFKKLSDFK